MTYDIIVKLLVLPISNLLQIKQHMLLLNNLNKYYLHR